MKTAQWIRKVELTRGAGYGQVFENIGYTITR